MDEQLYITIVKELTLRLESLALENKELKNHIENLIEDLDRHHIGIH